MDRPTTARVVTYYRMSSDQQEASIGEQQEWAERAARKEGLDIVAEFKDEGIAGDEVARRPGLQSLLAYCDSPPRGVKIDGVMCWDGDRFSRADSFKTAAILDRLIDAGVSRMYTQDGWADFGEEIDRVMWSMRQDLSRSAYSRSISRNITRSGLSRAKEGRWVAGRPPYGYAIGTDGRLVLGNPDHVAIVLRIFTRYTQCGDSLGDICLALNNEGVPNPGGRGKWNRATVRKILIHPAYCGDACWNKNGYGKYHAVKDGEVSPLKGRNQRGKVRPIPESDRIIVTDAHPGIVDRAVFESAQKRLRSRRAKDTTPLPGGGEWVLSGLIRCGDCEGKMSGRTYRYRRPKGVEYVYRHYVCTATESYGKGACRTRGVRQDLVLDAVAEWVKAGFASIRAEVIERIQSHAGELAKVADRHEESLTARAEKIDADLAVAYRNLGLVSPDMLPHIERTIRDLTAERDKLIRERADIRESIEQHTADTARLESALGALSRLAEVIDRGEPKEIRQTIATALESITIHFNPESKGYADRIREVTAKVRSDISEVVADWVKPATTSLVSFTLPIPSDDREIME